MYIPEDHRKKFDTRGEKFILVGYMDELRAYKLIHHQMHQPKYA